MLSTSLSSATLKGLVKLVEKRDHLRAEIARVEAQISAQIGKSPAPKTKAKRGKRGALKERVLAALKAAGKSGISVKELSSKLGVKNQNLHVWFNTTGRKVKGLKRSGPGLWTLA